MPKIPERYSGLMMPGWITTPARPKPGGDVQTAGVSDDWLAAALRIFTATLHKGDAVADLGCLHGAYTIAFAKAGYRVLGVDARAENVTRAAEAAQEAGVDVKFAQADVRSFDEFEFSGVWCAGLLYHLEKPAEFLRTLFKITRKVAIIQTHFSMREAVTENEGYLGHWYREDVTHPFSAWGNEQSFWLTKPHLLNAVEDAGFPLVFEVHSHLTNVNGMRDRVMIAAIKDLP